MSNASGPSPSFKLPAGGSFVALLPELSDHPFWQMLPSAATPDYADGLEELIADFNRQPEDALAAWAGQHPLTADQRFILEYNTSPDRANVLRPLPFAAGERILEIGCGCGAVSQYLWGRAQTVSLDASAARARAAAHRLARQANPHQSVLVCADFHQLTGDGSFDWVIFNGVLEYAAIYSGAGEPSPYVAMLRKAATFLRPGGRCVIAIENRLGLKYFAGAPEDHYGRPAVGLEGYATLGKSRPSIRTFSRPELAGLCEQSGLAAPEFLFPFPDYKFARIIVPDDPRSWQFAAERMIETSPAWRGGREHHLDEAAVFRSLAAGGGAGDFAHSFLVVTTRPGKPARPVGVSDIHYYPLHRTPADAVYAVLDLNRREVRRRKLGGGPLAAAALPQFAPGNPRAGLVPPIAGSGPDMLVQPLSAVPTLWEELRLAIGATTDSSEVYKAQLEVKVQTQQALYLAGLPFTPAGSWPAFVAKLRAEFARADLGGAAAGALAFLENQREFAATSLARLQLKPWTWWAPDWIMENLFAAPDGGVRLFDVEYVDPTACLPTPALVCRQMRLLQLKTAQPELATHWPWPPARLSLETSITVLPQPAAQWAITALWGDLPAPEADRHFWFWSKVAQVIEGAMVGTVAAPFQRTYGTRPWLQSLSAELAAVDKALALQPVVRGGAERKADSAPAERQVAEELAKKEHQIRELHTAAQERLAMVEKIDRELNRVRAVLETLQPDPHAPWRTPLPAETRNIHLQSRLDESRRQLQVARSLLTEREAEVHLLKLRLRARIDAGPVHHRLHNFYVRLAGKAEHPLAQLRQHEPRPLRREEFPKPRRGVHWPRICLVTPSYQQGGFIERTMLSALDQNYPNLAYGVQDGGSTDESTAIITRHLPKLAHAESAPDTGQSDAIRRGFAKLYPGADDIMGWLNSDDMLMPGALHYIGGYFARHPEVDVVYGHRVVIDEADREVGRWFMPRYHRNTVKWFDLVPQETLFWRSRCYQEIGGLDPTFQFALDWDLLLRLDQACFTIRRLPYFLGCFRVHPEQKTSAKIQSVGEQEMSRIRRRIHQREVSVREVEQHLTAEIQRSAMVERLHRLGVRY